ncbi:MAG TPA: sulfotransferase [Gemmatimonadales bacterium]|nr:sulfotransferase [Gemmatimonadales bacterium]
MIKISKPIFIVGTGRCGSTALHQLLALHPNLMWLSGLSEQFPERPALNRWAVTAVGNPLVRRLLARRIKPGENYGFWYTHAYGFAEPGRDLVGDDVTPRVRKQMWAALEPMLTQQRHRMLVKLTGWSRIGFLNEVFGDAKFIHIVRDGRAVASSLLHINDWQWRGWYGPYSWRYGPLSAEDQAAWEARHRSFVALAGLQWRIHTRAIESARKALDPSRFLEVRYESFCEHPMETCRQVVEFAELADSAAFKRQVHAATIRDMTNRWRKDLSLEQQEMLTELLREDLVRYGYEPGD